MNFTFMTHNNNNNNNNNSNHNKNINNMTLKDLEVVLVITAGLVRTHVNVLAAVHVLQLQIKHTSSSLITNHHHHHHQQQQQQQQRFY